MVKEKKINKPEVKIASFFLLLLFSLAIIFGFTFINLGVTLAFYIVIMVISAPIIFIFIIFKNSRFFKYLGFILLIIYPSILLGVKIQTYLLDNIEKKSVKIIENIEVSKTDEGLFPEIVDESILEVGRKRYVYKVSYDKKDFRLKYMINRYRTYYYDYSTNNWRMNKYTPRQLRALERRMKEDN